MIATEGHPDQLLPKLPDGLVSNGLTFDNEAPQLAEPTISPVPKAPDSLADGITLGGNQPQATASTYTVQQASAVKAPADLAEGVRLGAETQKLVEPYKLRFVGAVAVDHEKPAETPADDTVDADIVSETQTPGKELVHVPTIIPELVSDEEYAAVLKGREEDEKMQKIEAHLAAARMANEAEHDTAHERAETDHYRSMNDALFRVWQRVGLYSATDPSSREDKNRFGTIEAAEQYVQHAERIAAQAVLIKASVDRPLRPAKDAETNRRILDDMYDEVQKQTAKGKELTGDLATLLLTYQSTFNAKISGFDKKFVEGYFTMVAKSMQDPNTSVKKRMGMLRRSVLLTFLWSSSGAKGLPFRHNFYEADLIRSARDENAKTS